MTAHADFENNDGGKAQLHKLIRQMKIVLGGNRKLKIYGTLQCSSGKRMLRENRVFFSSEAEAIAAGFRPCGHCMKDKYHQWKNEKE
jgi:Metal binding domain of Ada